MARRMHRGFAGGLIGLLAVLAGGGADAGPLEPQKPSQLVFLFAGGGQDCPCSEGSKVASSLTGADGRTEPFALGKREAIVLTGGTINVFSVTPGEEHLVSVSLFDSTCTTSRSVEQRIAAAGASGVSVTDFDFDFGLALNDDAILCIRASIGPTPLDAQGRFRGFRTKDR